LSHDSDAMTRHDAAWHDAQYNNRARVADHAQFFARWAADSALARSQLACQLDVAFGDDPVEKLDIFPATAPGAPVLVFIHGGYWRSLDKSDFSFVAPAFVRCGAAVVVPNYGLCPAVSIETIALQSARALAWVWRNAAAIGADPARIVVVGHSAGAHLAAMLLACRWRTLGDDLPLRLLAGAVSLSGLFDLEPLRHAPFLQGDLKLTPTSVKRLSPAFFARPRGPLHALVGGDESAEFIRQNRLIRDQWGPSTVPVCEVLAGRHHFDIVDDLIDPVGQSHDCTLRLLGLRQ
jgi:arylformamidase